MQKTDGKERRKRDEDEAEVWEPPGAEAQTCKP